jgi:hypothetical protein
VRDGEGCSWRIRRLRPDHCLLELGRFQSDVPGAAMPWRNSSVTTVGRFRRRGHDIGDSELRNRSMLTEPRALAQTSATAG